MGSIDDKGLSAAFFMPTRPSQSAQALLQAAGATNIHLDPYARAEFWNCEWATLHCTAFVLAMQTHDMLVLRFMQSDFLRLVPGSESEPDHSLRVAEAFSTTCSALRPDVAFITVGLRESQADWIQALYAPLVARQDANALVETQFGLLHLSAAFASQWDGFEPYQNIRAGLEGPLFKFHQWREGLNAASDGVYLFAGSGHRRWW